MQNSTENMQTFCNYTHIPSSESTYKNLCPTSMLMSLCSYRTYSAICANIEWATLILFRFSNYISFLHSHLMYIFLNVKIRKNVLVK